MSNEIGIGHNSDMFDTSAEELDTKSDPAIKRLVELADVLINHKELVEDLTRNLAEANGFVNNIQMIEMPDLMAECGLTEFTHHSGTKIKIKDFVSGSLPKEPEKRKGAFEELERIGDRAIDLVKTTISVTFDKSEHREALDLAEKLKAEGYDGVAVDSGIHHSTLQAFVKECLKKGVKIDPEKLGMYVGKTTDVKPPKDK